MADVAIVIGHHESAPGAVLELINRPLTEYHFWKPFAHELALTLEAAGRRPVVIERPNPRPDGALAATVNRTGAKCAIELHFNSYRDPAARGTEMLYWGDSQRGRDLADLLQDRTSKALGTVNRGLRAIDGGFPFLALTSMPAVICEPAFGSNLDDAWRLITRQSQLMAAYRSAIIDFLG